VSYCPLDFSDAFDDESRGAPWQRTTAMACTATEDGTLAASFPTDAQASCDYRTGRRYALGQQPIGVRLARTPELGSVASQDFTVENRLGTRAGVWLYMGSVYIFQDQANIAMTPYDPAIHDFWRMSAPIPGQVLLESRGVATAWQERATFEIDAGAAYFELGARSESPYAPAGTTATVEFDDFNLVE
jgi:hypothetical protein